MKMFSWWPLAWNSNLRRAERRLKDMEYDFKRLCEDYQKRGVQLNGEIETLKKEKADLSVQMGHMQARFGEIVRDHWPDRASRPLAAIIRETEKKIDEYAVFTSNPVMKPYHQDFQVWPEQVRMVEFTMGVGLTRSTPPELVAADIGKRMEECVLKHWRSQSLLLKKGPVAI